jgi:hypothetical protein
MKPQKFSGSEAIAYICLQLSLAELEVQSISKAAEIAHIPIEDAIHLRTFMLASVANKLEEIRCEHEPPSPRKPELKKTEFKYCECEFDE